MPRLHEAVAPAPLESSPITIQQWFETAVDAEQESFDGTLAGARRSAMVYARKAKSENTRRAYRIGVRAWCEWANLHDLPCLPARGEDVVAFLADERRRGLSVNTVDLRRAAIRYLHFIAGCPLPTVGADVAETLAGIRRDAAELGERPHKKMATTVGILKEILASIELDIVGSRDRALLLLGFVGALRRSELARVRVEHLELKQRGFHLLLPISKGDREGQGVSVAVPYGQTELCPVRAIQHWQAAAGISAGPLFRRIWSTPSGDGVVRHHTIGHDAIDPRTVARIIQGRAGDAGFDAAALGGHSLKRGAMTTGMDQGVHPTRLKRLGRHKSYAVMDEYLEIGDGFEAHPLSGLL